jgi:hypothetical protein
MELEELISIALLQSSEVRNCNASSRRRSETEKQTGELWKKKDDRVKALVLSKIPPTQALFL